MKIHELFESYRNIDQVIQAYRNQYQDEIDAGCERGNCGFPATGFEQFASNNGFAMIERVQGYFMVDIPDPDNLKPGEELGDPRSKKIPHQWNEYRGQIIDFTGQAQFVDTGLASDTNDHRYIYS